ncbi:MAG: outer membrane protein assembly factor BamD [Planctomycetota bacterium]
MKQSCIALLVAAVVLSVAVSAWGEHVWKDGQWVESPEPAEGTAPGELELIRKHLEADEPDDAADAAEDFLQDYPDHPGRQEAMILWAQAEMADGDYYDAYERFEAYLDAYPSGRYVDRALRRELEIGTAFLQGRRRKVLLVIPLPGAPDGVEIIEKVIARAPRSRPAALAMLRLAEYYMDHGRYGRAVETCDQFLQAFPDAPESPEMMLTAARATYRSFKGPAFDDTPLLEAEQRFRLFVERYPERAADQGARRTLEQIRELRASKLMKTASFYRRVGRRGSAIYYYRRLVERYPETTSAEEARAALDALGAAATAPEPPAAATRPAGTGPEESESR